MSKHILIVEDQEDNRRILRDLFANAGYELIEAESGEEALSALATSRPDLILMDIQLPVMDGYEATRRIRSNPELNSIPIIAVTSYALAGDEAKGAGRRLQCLHHQALQSPRAAREGARVLGVGSVEAARQCPLRVRSDRSRPATAQQRSFQSPPSCHQYTDCDMIQSACLLWAVVQE